MERGISVEWIARLFEHPDLLRMGHSQSAADLNLGLGWLYYAFGRFLRPRRAVVIGSWRGFVPLVIAKALQDNQEPGEVVFVEPRARLRRTPSFPRTGRVTPASRSRAAVRMKKTWRERG